MSILTTAQLTFCDLKDSYSIHMDTECIGLACDTNGLVLEAQEISINYRVLAGTDRVNATCEVSEFPSGVTLKSNTATTTTQDGVLTLNIAQNATLNGKQSSSFKVVFTVQDDEQFTFERYVTFVKYMTGAEGAAGENAVSMEIYSAHGLMFKEDLTAIELKVAAFDGAASVTGATYTWEWWNDSISSYEIIIAGTSAQSFTVNSSAVYALASLKCTMTYNNKTYIDYITLTNETMIYTSVVKFFNGSNIFNSDDSYLAAYVELYQNNSRVETIAAGAYCLGVSSVDSSGVITAQLTEQYTEGAMMYFIIQDSNGLYQAILGQYTSNQWIQVDYSTQYTYENSLYPTYPTSTNIIVISKEDINKSQNIDFTVYKDDTVISYTHTMVIDSNDPIVSGDEPTNPVDKQLWLDTSVNPSVLKIYSQETNEWLECSQQTGKSIYTSQPSSYVEGDLWILAEGEKCGDFGPGSMLKATTTSDTFSELHWIDADKENTSLKNNIKQYFSFNAETGLKIGQADNAFYVNIDSTNMGFHSIDTSGTDSEVVQIGINSATIQNATFEGSNGTIFKNDATFENNATFNQQINIYKQDSVSGFTWKLEENNSLSLAILNVT